MGSEADKVFRSSMGNLIGVSAQMQRLYPLFQQASCHRYSVLITGERGTGKKLAARSIHSLGPCASRPFISVDCTALVPTLVESELFGYARDAFIGASQAKEGLLHIAEAGTLFLDEIGELPMKLQAKLFRVLQDGEFSPIGSREQCKFRARVIAATRRNLAEHVRAGTFREDLYFRLNVVQMALPPLRERKPDVALLADYFLEKYADSARPARSISDAAMECLLAYSWPGNVRELEDAVQWALSFASGQTIAMDDLPVAIRNAAARKLHGAAGRVSRIQSEYMAIIRALDETGGDRGAAAHLLRIDKSTLDSKLKHYGL